MFPERYRGGIFIAEPRLREPARPDRLPRDLRAGGRDRATDYEVFAEGWLRGAVASGQPVDVLVMPDGALLVSDDKAGRLYRIRWTGP